jgi:hypothetical protein
MLHQLRDSGSTSVSTSGTSGASSMAGALPDAIFLCLLQAEQVRVRRKLGGVAWLCGVCGELRVGVELVRCSLFISSSEVEARLQ